MRVWITSCLVLFGMVELYQWLEHFTLPLPVFILGGVLLAIASNSNTIGSYSFRDSANQAPSLMNASHSSHGNSVIPSQTKLASQARQSISFVINRSTEQHRTAELD